MRRGGRGNSSKNNNNNNNNKRSSSAYNKGRNYANASQSARIRSYKKLSYERTVIREKNDQMDEKFGYKRYLEGDMKIAWLLNMQATSLPDNSDNTTNTSNNNNNNNIGDSSDGQGRECSGLDLYFLEQDGSTFKTTIFHRPYFYIGVINEYYISDMSLYLQRKFESSGMIITAVDLEDLDMPNHLSGKLHKFLKLSFNNVDDLMEVKSQILPIVKKNKKNQSINESYVMANTNTNTNTNNNNPDDMMDTIIDMREYDVPYITRTSIDLDLRVGLWYSITPEGDGFGVKVEHVKEMIDKAEPKVFAFDIECTKAPLKFPDANVDHIFMISYMVDGQGYLIINRDVVSEDIHDFEYTPKPSFPGPFVIFNERNEQEVIRRFLDHCQDIKPHVYVTYNGDFFDWPFIENRCKVYGWNMYNEIGIQADIMGEYRGRFSIHLDCFAWVKRDSYLPQGSQGLKAVTKYKLGYNPVEVHPELMVKYAKENPLEMASYSVSDAVATYYLYMVYVHNFIFSLCTIIPMGPEDVLRKGSGTLCEMLLMVEAFKGKIVCPNKQGDGGHNFYEGHLLESETYIGGHVECLETGVFRSDIKYKFNLVPSALDGLIANVDRDMSFALEVENKTSVDSITNYNDVKEDLIAQLLELRDNPKREEEPSVYHLDVGAMYPNIILTNRLQPCSIVTQSDCAACEFNQESNKCKRDMDWVWRGDYNPATRGEYNMIKTQLSYENFEDGKRFHELDPEIRDRKIKERLKSYSHKVYKKTKVTKEEKRTDTVCMRENPFYVNTVLAFRDRRYEYKALTKKSKKEKQAADAEGDAVASKIASDKETVFDSLQLAHKCILNSFYGYVMRKGARWRSMEMAGIVTNTGSELITQARELVEQIGRPLELDTDGIWCILPKSFPEDFDFFTKEGKKITISYPCVMLNADVDKNYTNDQYQTLVDPASKRYDTHSECSIFFEVDGPYKCMVLPASTEENKLLKKRYAVFNFDGSLAELKGFELKRRGELELIKSFQSQVFEQFLKGDTLEECYEAVGEVANFWVDVIDSQGEDLEDEELMNLISENKTISRVLEDYGDQKGTSLTTAARIGEFLGADMVKDKGLNCQLIIAKRPHGAPITERAIPSIIFAAEESVKRHYLKKWLKFPAMENYDVRDIIDWDYYKDRLGKTIQKIITIPAAIQNVENPVPRIRHPDWLAKRVRAQNDVHKQKKITSMFSKAAGAYQNFSNKQLLLTSAKAKENSNDGIVADIEDIGSGSASAARRQTAVVRKIGPKSKQQEIVLNSTTSNASASQEDSNDMAVDKENTPVQQLMKKAPVAPPMEEDFQGWLAFRKRQWKAKRIENRAIKNLNAANGTRTKKRQMTAVENFLDKAADEINYGTWQIIEIRETDTPGEFIVWAMTGTRSLQKLNLTVERNFFVNCRSEKLNEVERMQGRMKKVDKLLPHARKAQHLYEIELSERMMLENESSVSHFLSNPDVEGIYELQTPLLSKAIVQLGCTAKVIKHNQKNRVFKLNDLAFLSSADHKYLHPSVAQFRRIFYYHAEMGNRGILALFILKAGNDLVEPDNAEEVDPIEAYKAKAYVWLVGSFSRSETKPPFNKIFERYAPTGTKSQFESHVVDTMEAAMHEANLLLEAYQRKKNGPTIIVTQSANTILKNRKSIPLLNDFPVIDMPDNAEDSRFPALGWQTYAAQRMVQRYLLMVSWFQEQLISARYSHIPLGNIGIDSQVMMADTFYSRMLINNRQILWASFSTKPDIGGAEMDENDVWADELKSPIVNVPGAYRSVCVELDICGLAVASVICSAELEILDEAQGISSLEVNQTGGEGVEGKESSNVTEAVGDEAACANAFRVLRSLLQMWLQDVSRSENDQADALLVHFYRWICAKGSLLYDPMIQRIVHNLMNKVFLRLIAELRRLGANIVFASFTKIIISTNKPDLEKAKEYGEFILKTVVSRDIFQFLQITPSKYWDQLLWMDQENYGGMEINDGSEEEVEHISEDIESEEEEDYTFSDTEYEDSEARENKRKKKKEEREGSAGDTLVHDSKKSKPPPIFSHWNMADFLPNAAKEYFLLMIGEFLYRPYQEKVRVKEEYERSVALLSAEYAEQNQSDHEMALRALRREEEQSDEKMTMYMRNFISGYASKRMLDIVPEIEHYCIGADSFPRRMNARFELTNPCLEFIKIVCQIFYLDPTIEQQITVMRRALLAQINIREFSKASQFQDYALSFVLPDLICTYCNFCRDIDLCRDPGLFVDEIEDRWRCTGCGHKYDTDKVEQELVEMVNRMSTRYQLADIRCNKCRRISVFCTSETCQCSGKLISDEPYEVFHERINILSKLAKFHRFEWLHETIQHILYPTMDA